MHGPGALKVRLAPKASRLPVGALFFFYHVLKLFFNQLGLFASYGHFQLIFHTVNKHHTELLNLRYVFGFKVLPGY